MYALLLSVALAAAPEPIVPHAVVTPERGLCPCTASPPGACTCRGCEGCGSCGCGDACRCPAGGPVAKPKKALTHGCRRRRHDGRVWTYDADREVWWRFAEPGECGACAGGACGLGGCSFGGCAGPACGGGGSSCSSGGCGPRMGGRRGGFFRGGGRCRGCR